ncbi:transposase [Lewinella sp. W8]|uniref:transposase n=1 Tax=Lewinella sp. W8 TaxID=2528208 RepID=UPI001067333C|nr:transposase [Lewinella sp. W8]MTB52265.1 hypothetical protein [Lewinella sp. W8]
MLICSNTIPYAVATTSAVEMNLSPDKSGAINQTFVGESEIFQLNSKQKLNKSFYRSRLPHLVPTGGTFFITCRLKGAIPMNLMRQLRNAKRTEQERIGNSKRTKAEQQRLIKHQEIKFFQRMDAVMDCASGDGCVLGDPTVAGILFKYLLNLDGNGFSIVAFCIMPNHLHLLLSLGTQLYDKSGRLKSTELTEKEYKPLHEIMKGIKGGSARQINLYLGRTGPLWQKDSYDRLIRDERSLQNSLGYILNNPVKAGIVENSSDYEFTYVAPNR